MLNHILIASPEDLAAEAERISLLDEPDREEAILELLQDLQDYAQDAAYNEEDSWDPDIYEREDDSMELADDPYSV